MTEFIKKEEIKFWLAIFGVIIAGVIAFIKLQTKVEAMVEREQINKDQFFRVVEVVDKLLYNQIIIGATLKVEGLKK